MSLVPGARLLGTQRVYTRSKRKGKRKRLTGCIDRLYTSRRMAERDNKRGNRRLVTFWCPGVLVPAIGRGARKTDSDMSKFIRAAVREKLVRHGVPIPHDDPTVAS